jgi:hypothetical protein
MPLVWLFRAWRPNGLAIGDRRAYKRSFPAVARLRQLPVRWALALAVGFCIQLGGCLY